MAHLDAGGAGGLAEETGVVICDSVIAAHKLQSAGTGHLGAARLFGDAEAEVHGSDHFVTGQGEARKKRNLENKVRANFLKHTS